MPCENYYLRYLSSKILNIIYHFDTCGGQSKGKCVGCVLTTIEQEFVQSDSDHSTLFQLHSAATYECKKQ